MIFDAIVKFLMLVFNGVLALIPSWTPDFGGAGGSIGTALSGANSWFPMVTLGICVIVVMAARLALFGLTLITWLWDKVPFKMS